MKQSVYIIHCPPSWFKTAPLALVYLYTYLKHKGFCIKIKDLNLELFKQLNSKQEDWLSLNSEFEENIFNETSQKIPLALENLYAEIKTFDVVGFSILKRNYSFSLALAQKIAEKFPDKKIIFGGPHTLFLDWQNRLNKRFNWIIGEGESALAEMLSSDKEKILRFKELENLDSLGMPDFETLNPADYSNSIPLLSSRGCPFRCKFCSEKELYKKFRQHSPGFMVSQIAYLNNKYKGNDFTFCDSLINYDNNWLAEFCRLLVKNNLKIKWQAQIRIDKNFSHDLGDLMRLSGCYNLFIGLESASDKVLKNMQKGFSQDIALDFFKKLNTSGIQFEISLIFGYPQETDADFKETLDFVIKNKKIIPKIAQANPFVDYLGNFGNTYPTKEAKSRILEFLMILELEKIRYTKSFINNLVY